MNFAPWSFWTVLVTGKSMRPPKHPLNVANLGEVGSPGAEQKFGAGPLGDVGVGSREVNSPNSICGVS